MPSKRAIGDLAGIIGGPVVSPPEPAKPKNTKQRAERIISTPIAPRVVHLQPRLLDGPDEQSDRITVILPISLLTQVDGRVAALRRKKKVSVSGYIEAALRELLATGEHDIEALERYRISARRSLSKVR